MLDANRLWPAAALALALAWGLGPALPAWSQGQLIGQPFTDLYPAVWGLWWFVEQQPGLPTWCAQLGAPEGMPFYYSSPLHGWLATPLLGWLGLTHTWNLGVVLARVATVLSAYAAGRAWGLREPGALVAAAVYGCAPFFQGYAVEGIVEGLDGWTLALWLWALARQRPIAAALAFALTVMSSWYMAATACVVAALLGPRAWLSMAGGLALSYPALHGFLGAFSGRVALDPAVRAAMGTELSLSAPGLLEGLNPFAKTSWVGLIAPALAALTLRERPERWRGALLILGVCGLLSFGVGPWYSLPPFSGLRFPYRFHAGTLLALAWLAGHAAERWRHGGWLAGLIALEGLLLSPIEPILPGAPAEVDPVYAELPEGRVLLDLPGPLAMPPGEVNLSRPRARWFLYAQTAHGRASPWVPDFNGVGVRAQDGLDGARALDPLLGQAPPEALDLPESVDLVVVHRDQLRGRGELAHRLLTQEGWRLVRRVDSAWLYERGAP
ncbi:MAG: hypothetical protein H6741_03985 [Alphaproteobacteria bacterium]|nr:hypothetical protein [Alphaproteobacteria bacterium]MCB9791866.1 hypothetical protein [Alphaproteobacteria bacterium]